MVLKTRINSFLLLVLTLISSLTLLNIVVFVASSPGITYYNSRDIFNQYYKGCTLEDFEEGNIAPNSYGWMHSPLDEHTSNAYFSSGDIATGIRFQENPKRPPEDPFGGLSILGAGFTGNPSNVVMSNYLVDSYDIIFLQGVYSVGMDLHSQFSPTATFTIKIYGPGDTLLDTTTSLATNAGSFWGVSSDVFITRINLYSSTVDAEGADNIVFNCACAPIGGEMVLANNIRVVAPLLVVFIAAVALNAGMIYQRKLN